MTIQTGQRITPARINPVTADLRQTAAQTLTNNLWTAINFDAEDIDSNGGHSTASNTSRYTCQVAGTYMLAGAVAFTSNTTGQRWCRWHLNGSEIFGVGANADAVTGQPTLLVARTTIIQLSPGDFVELAGFQSSGAGLATYVSPGYAQSSMSVVRVATS